MITQIEKLKVSKHRNKTKNGTLDDEILQM